MNKLTYLIFGLFVFLNGSAFAEGVISLHQQFEGVTSADGKYRVAIVIRANAIIDDSNEITISQPKMALFVKDTTNQSSWEASVGKITKPGHGYVDIKIEDAAPVRRLEMGVEITIGINNSAKVIISNADFAKLNNLIDKNKNIPNAIVDSWKGLAKNWFDASMGSESKK